jgi:hypothetical protein
MESNIYRISKENFETILKYYKIINKKVNNYYSIIIKYREYTKEYYSKLKELFEKDKKNFDVNEYEIIEINLDLNDKDSVSNSMIFNRAQLYQKNVEICLIQKSIKKINKFFQGFITNLESFIESLEIPLSILNQCIEISDIEINSIKTNHYDQEKTFDLKYSEFYSLNKDLRKLYGNAERQLAEFYIEKNKLKNKNIKIEQLENNLNKSLSEKAQEQNAIFEKFNSLGNFGVIFNESTNEKINYIKDFTSSLFLKFGIFINNIFSNFKKSFLLPMNQYMNFEDEINIDKEMKSKNEFNELLNKYIKNIDEKEFKFHFTEYNLNVVENSFINQEKLRERKKLMKESSEDSFEEIVIQNDYKYNLDEEGIFFVTKNMYEKFKLINKNNYNLDVEEKLLRIKKAFDKLTAYGAKIKNKSDLDNVDDDEESEEDNDIKGSWNLLEEETNSIKDNNDNDGNDNKIQIMEINKEKKDEEITQEEIDDILKLMNDKLNRKYLLLKLNKFRTLGVYEMPLEIFNYFKQIFCEISKYLYIEIDQENNDKKELKVDIEISNLVIILSQTFFCIKNDKKVYIQNELKDVKVFHEPDFWVTILKNSINKEFKKLGENSKEIENMKGKKIKEKINQIAFAQILPNISGMVGFGLNKEEIKAIVVPLIKEYEISEENKKIITSYYENPNDF